MRPLTLVEEDKSYTSFAGTFAVRTFSKDGKGVILVLQNGIRYDFPQTIGNMANLEQWERQAGSPTQTHRGPSA